MYGKRIWKKNGRTTKRKRMKQIKIYTEMKKGKGN